MSFAFSFSGDDIDEELQADNNIPSKPTQAPAAPSSAFPVAGKPLLPTVRHDFKQMLSLLPSKIAFGLLGVELDGGETIQLPRRELWDVRVQLMAEDDDGGEAEPGLGSHDVKTGVYEGGFKSWESSVDLVKVLEQSKPFLSSQDEAPCVVELGCGTALPSLAMFQWAASTNRGEDANPLTIILADYNSTVLQLVTLPNFILSWALQQRTELPLVDAALSSEDGELDLTPEVIQAFQEFLSQRKVNIEFISGAWCQEFVELVENALPANANGSRQRVIVLGAETIYSPFALQSFTDTVFSLLSHQKAQGNSAEVLAAAKKLYFGVGGSLDDFVTKARELGATVETLREETEGVRRGVVQCHL
ncbi:hypothetical protein JX265_008660 [Neoarthrinium moseri]|uniref:protein-histidine N-methyltransferase n=1 Tax=Neoarthrinium moseri TaxID=1658444 RepID=A0A9P9WHD9_9PEZI|nr:hypothetical protein JX265_008660 [Neoarthrinium moseri]